MTETVWVAEVVDTLATVECACWRYTIVFGIDGAMAQWGTCGWCGEQPVLIETDGEGLMNGWQLVACMSR